MPTQKNTPGAPSLTELEAQIQQLNQSREVLEARRLHLRDEELKVLADAFARKLRAAGFTIRQGIAALRPYANTALAAPPAPAAAAGAASAAPSPTSAASAPVKAHAPRKDPQQELRERAACVLGGEGEQWLDRPHPLLGGQTPMNAAATVKGLDQVHALLAAYAREA